MTKRILIIGGHLTPALAVIEELKKRGGWEIAWVGRTFSMEGRKIPPLEYEVIPQLGIPYFVLDTARLQRRWSEYTLPSLLRLPRGLLQAFTVLRAVNPHVVLSFGGYVSIPVIIVSWLLRIPIVIHEQTTTSGLANRIAAFFASRIALSYPSSSLEFPRHKTVLTGNPIQSSILAVGKRRRRRGHLASVLYITGGNQGSQVINKAIEPLLPTLVQRLTVIHQTGFLDYPRFVSKAKRLGKRYQPFAVIPPKDIPAIYERARLVISRSGANTVAELAAVGVPALLIPLPWAERDEQEKNARLLVNTGLASLVPQEQLTPQTLEALINDALAASPKSTMIQAARSLIILDASARLVNLVEHVTT